jgi:hypothetical protein
MHILTDKPLHQHLILQKVPYTIYNLPYVHNYFIKI